MSPMALDERQKYITVGCGKCSYCRKKDAMEWQTRLREHFKRDKKAIHWVTFTLSDQGYMELDGLDRNYTKKGYDYDNSIVKTGMRLWRKKMENLGYKSKDLDYWFISEIGSKNTQRIHLHGFVWANLSATDLKDTWRFGSVWHNQDNDKKFLTEGAVGYTLKYMTKVDKDHPDYRPKRFVSNGIGAGYLEDPKILFRHRFRGKNTTVTYYDDGNGKEYQLPTYYKRKLWTDDERALLHSYNLDWKYYNKQKLRFDDEVNINMIKDQMIKDDVIYDRKNNKKTPEEILLTWKRRYEERVKREKKWKDNYDF